MRAIRNKNRLLRLIKVQSKRIWNLSGDRRIIARGIAVGISMNFIPTISFGLPIVYWVTKLFKGHKVASIISTMAIKPIFPALYILNYIVGQSLLSRELSYTADWRMAAQPGLAFFLGSAVNFVASFIASYYWSLWFIDKKRKK